MPFPATPFRLPRNASARRNAGPQFASTPRFLLSQNATPADDDHDVIDDTESRLTRPATYTPVPPAATRARRRDAIDDFDNADDMNDGFVRMGDRNGLPGDAIESSPPEQAEGTGVLDADFDALFAPTREGHKRRRMDRGTPCTSTKLTQFNPISSSPPQTADMPPNHVDTPVVRRESPAIWEMGTQRTPGPSARPIAPSISTPGDMKTPFRGRPRFMFSSAAKPPSSQSAPKFKPSTPAISPPERRKPTFVLPRSPSPNPDAEDIPAPFSPTSRTLSRRGRKRGAVSYVPGGMAAQLRSWVLEMGAKREQLPKPTLIQSTESESKMPSSEALAKFLVAARVTGITHFRTASCGSIAFLRAEPVVKQQVQDIDVADYLNILIMGPPRSKPDFSQSPSDLIPQNGDLIGIHRGLTWTLRLGSLPGQVEDHNGSTHPALPDAIPVNEENVGAKEPWLVAMEWDLVHVPSKS
ncbi:hypothetical protein N7452_007060 [Penicillium brevicompactum]|uniref:Uncharacterized protein n=1 Tax=Penicillium brevicompactum TaxID=5074 RepID=A0A9W9QEP6_PENBR|nr:hypothetical protein N7452_007060 [Penicillium brevicompactum]